MYWFGIIFFSPFPNLVFQVRIKTVKCIHGYFAILRVTSRPASLRKMLATLVIHNITQSDCEISKDAVFDFQGKTTIKCLIVVQF